MGKPEKERSIIEKLGITVGPWEITGAFRHFICKGDQLIADCSTNKYGKIQISENTNLIAAAPEMLEALIMFCNEYTGIYTKYDPRRATAIKVIQKATGKSWEEIKGLINGES